MLIHYSVIVFIGFLLVQALVYLLKKVSFKFNVLISENIPRIGGIAMGLSFAVVSLFICLLSVRLSQDIVGIITASMIILIFGIIDDWRNLSIKAKFLVQIISTFLLILFGIRTQIVYIGSFLNIIITFLWVIGISNAFNHLDIIDGLGAGTAGIIGLSFFVISLLCGNINPAILSLSLAVVAFSFLIYNLPPARIYMGNSGSHFLGFVLAAVALLISYAPLERKIALATPILILGLPIFDTAFLIWIRKKQKKPIFKKSNDHFALRLLKAGYPKVKTLILMLSLCLFFCLCGMAVSQASNLWGIVIVAFVFLVSLRLSIRIGKVSIID